MVSGASTRRGIVVFGASLASMADTAEAADRAGFDSVWAQELYNRSATVTLAACAPRTRRVTIGSGIMYGVGRSPLMLSAEARDLDELTGGRFVLGLGNGTRTMIRDWHGLDGEAPASRIEELVPLVRRLWNLHEGPVRHEGRFYRVKIAALEELVGEPPRRIPIYTAGVNPRMIESAGRVSDGLLGHTLFSPRYIEEVVRPAIERGAAHADRDPGDVRLTTYTLGSVHEDAEQARREAAAMIAFYGSVKTYSGLLKISGFGREAEAIREAFGRRDTAGMIGAVTDAMVDEFACAGTPADVQEQVARFDGLVDEVVFSPPSFRLSPERIAENTTALAEHCAPGTPA